MSTPNEEPTLQESIDTIVECYRSLNGIIPGYVDFLVPCFLQLRQHNVPTSEAAMMAVQTLRLHLERYFPQDNAQEEDVNLTAFLLGAKTTGKGN